MQKPSPTRGKVLDIETRRHQNLKKNLGIDEKIASLDDMEVDQLQTFATETGVKLGNRKTREAVLAKCLDHLNGMVDKAALKLYGCEIYAIGVADVAGGPVSALSVTEEISEEDVIRRFLTRLDSDAPVCLMGFNIRNFDLPVLRARCASLGIFWPHWMPQNRRQDKYESDYVFDIQDVCDEGNLDTWLRMWGLPPKTGTGAHAAQMTPEEVCQYCADDVERERQMLAKVLVNYHPLQHLLDLEVV